MTAHPHVEIRATGAFVRNSDVPVRRLWAWYQHGVSVETLIKRYPTLGAAAVLSALSFAFDNEKLIRRELREEFLERQGNTERGDEE